METRDALIARARVLVLVVTPSALSGRRGLEAVREALVAAERGDGARWVPLLPVLFASGPALHALLLAHSPYLNLM